eukprot:14713077-Alexandrium_andersonii.AAC.1
MTPVAPQMGAYSSSVRSRNLCPTALPRRRSLPWTMCFARCCPLLSRCGRRCSGGRLQRTCARTIRLAFR